MANPDVIAPDPAPRMDAVGTYPRQVLTSSYTVWVRIGVSCCSHTAANSTAYSGSGSCWFAIVFLPAIAVGIALLVSLDVKPVSQALEERRV